ncbi:MAG: serine hydrolase [Flavobacteriales bacterium]|nr:serine hydrolase [Flavobacteriales bacterium]
MKFSFIILLTILSFPSYGQDMKDYTGSWQGEIADKNAFSLTISIQKQANGSSLFIISNEHELINKKFTLINEIQLSLSDKLSFSGIVNNEQSEINGFIKSGMLFYHIRLKKSGSNFIGKWNVLMIDSLKSQFLYLSIENGLEEEYEAYPIFGDDRFTGTWCANFNKNNDTISFSDFKTGLQFKGVLESSKILLSINLGNKTITKVSFEKTENDWNIGNLTISKGPQINDGWEFSSNQLLLPKMENDIGNKELDKTESVIIAKNGKIIYENYFAGFNAVVPHDMRSASKSISSAIVGVTIDKNLIKSVDQNIYEFLPEVYQNTKDSLKSKITIQSLLTMSSGIDAVDFGANSNSNSPATENNYQRTMNWTKSILETSMINKPFTHANYGSANPHLLGVAVSSVVEEPLELFMDQKLFSPLGISNYIIQSDMSGKPYFGGGMYLTPRDMLKFGQLYLNKGKWRNKRILSKKWIENSFKNYLNLENTIDKNGYGYLWWHHTYTINGRELKSVEARGAGGQYIFVIPKLKVVAVITSGNYRNKKGQQPEKILDMYILPILMEK